MTRLEVGNIRKDNLKTTGGGATRLVVKGIVEKTNENEFTGGSDKQKQRIKSPIRNMVEGALIEIVEQVRLDTILEPEWIGWPNPLVSWTPWLDKL